MSWFVRHNIVEEYFEKFVKWREEDVGKEVLYTPDKVKTISKLILSNQPTTETCKDVCLVTSKCIFANSTYCKIYEKHKFIPNFCGIFIKFTCYWDARDMWKSVGELLGERRVRYFKNYIYQRASEDWKASGKKYKLSNIDPESRIISRFDSSEQKHFTHKELLTISHTLEDPWSRFMSECKKKMSLEELIIKKGEENVRNVC